MERDIKDKIVVITGGADGIGFSIADNFLQKNAKVAIILDLNEELGDKAVYKLIAKHGRHRAVYLTCDVTKDLEEAFDKIIQVYKRTDILVNCAGVVLGHQPVNEAVKILEINTTAVVLWSLKYWDYMRKDKGGNGGTILNLASRHGYKNNPVFPVYQSKLTVAGFTKSLGHEHNYDRSGVRIVAICPNYQEAETVNTEKCQDEIESATNYVEERVGMSCGISDAVGRAAVEVFEQGESGSLWSVEDGNPILQVK